MLRVPSIIHDFLLRVRHIRTWFSEMALAEFRSWISITFIPSPLLNIPVLDRTMGSNGVIIRLVVVNSGCDLHTHWVYLVRFNILIFPAWKHAISKQDLY